MTYFLDPNPLFRRSHRLVVYLRGGKWRLLTFTERRLTAKEKKELVDYCCRKKRVGRDCVRFVRWKQIVAMD